MVDPDVWRSFKVAVLAVVCVAGGWIALAPITAVGPNVLSMLDLILSIHFDDEDAAADVAEGAWSGSTLEDTPCGGAAATAGALEGFTSALNAATPATKAASGIGGDMGGGSRDKSVD